jgi:hypothetical protein
VQAPTDGLSPEKTVLSSLLPHIFSVALFGLRALFVWASWTFRNSIELLHQRQLFAIPFNSPT